MRNGDWFLTFTGKKFYPIDPSPDDICIEDIAHALAHVCRFGGHCGGFYSVAQHSVLVSQICKQATFQGLMHDATEAYVGDMVRPLKLQLPDYQIVEDRVWEAICEQFVIAKTMHSEVKFADNVALNTERRDLFNCDTYGDWNLQDYPPLPERIEILPPFLAKEFFLDRYRELHRHFYGKP